MSALRRGIVACVMGWALARPALAGFQIVSEHLALDASQHNATFDVTFDRVPEFLSFDVDGIPFTSFQYEIEGRFDERAPDTTSDLTAIIRGDEIHFDHTVRIREPSGDGGPEAGGWGPLRDETAFVLKGSHLQFTTSWSALGIADFHLRYRLFTLEHGDLQDFREVMVVPLPSAVWMGGLGLGTLLVVNRVRSRRRTP